MQVLIYLGVFLMAFASSVLADSKSDYMDLMKEKYYLYEQQSFSKIRCKISVPIVDQTITGVKDQFKALGMNVNVEKEGSDFAFIYTKENGLTFEQPTLNITALEPDKLKDKQTFDMGVQKIKEGFSKQLDGVSKMFEGVFSENTMKDKEVLSFSKNDNEVTVEYKVKETTGTSRLSGNKRVSEFTGPSMSGSEDTQFESIDNHLLLSKSQAKIKMVNADMDINLKVTYDTVGGIILPKVIETITKIEASSVKQEIGINLNLEECVVEP